MALPAYLMALLALLGQADPPPDPEGAAPAEPELLRVLAIHGTNMGRAVAAFDPTLAALETYLAELPWDTFREAGFHELEAEYGVDNSVAIDDRYTLHCMPRNLSDAGEVLFDAHISLAQGDGSVKALDVSGHAARGQGVVFRGLDIPGGELIVVMTIAKAPDAGGGGTGQRPGDESGDGEQGAPEGEGSGQGDAGDEEGEMETPLDPGAREAEEEEDAGEAPRQPREDDEDLALPPPPDLANLEGILRALEEQDEREQQNARNRRYDVIIRGDWW